nr:serine/threonine protein kinase [Deltaproteobacteria bacterium]
MYPAPYASYMLLERLGTGGMSEVDLARRSVSGAGYVRLVVIKRIKADRTGDSSFVRMFKDEARITSELDHGNIGRVYDFGKEGDEYYLVLEYVPGVDLRQLISELAERKQRVPLRIALGILVRVLDALEHAHTKRDALGRPMSVVHRDVNPRNVMLSVRGDVKLIDFGVAFAEDRLERTRTDHVKGKFSYMAPEQISGEKVDHRADLYAVGLTLNELLTGQGTFSGLNQIQILHRMMSGEIPKLPPVPELI